MGQASAEQSRAEQWHRQSVGIIFIDGSNKNMPRPGQLFRVIL